MASPAAPSNESLTTGLSLATTFLILTLNTIFSLKIYLLRQYPKDIVSATKDRQSEHPFDRMETRENQAITPEIGLPSGSCFYEPVRLLKYPIPMFSEWSFQM